LILFSSLNWGVLQHTNKTKIKYIGLSNGCRVALSSTNEYQEYGKPNLGEYFNFDTGYWENIKSIEPDFVDTFIGTGCPGAFTGYLWYADYLSRFSKEILTIGENYSHITQQMIGKVLLDNLINLDTDDEKQQMEYIAKKISGTNWKTTTVSKNLLKSYLNFTNKSYTKQPVDSDLNIRNLRLYTNLFTSSPIINKNVIEIDGGHFYKPLDYTQDTVVSNIDIESIASIINSENSDKVMESENLFHARMYSDKFQKDVKEVLRK
jgi:hypothetical protein